MIEREVGDILDASGAPVAVLDGRTGLAYASPAFRSRQSLLDAVQGVTPGGEPERYQVLGEGEDRCACRIRVLPDGAVMVIALGAALQPSDHDAAVALVQSYWGLTPAEAEAAWLHARGWNLPQIAQARGVGIETVRTQMRAVREKTAASSGRGLQALFWSVLAGPAEP